MSRKLVSCDSKVTCGLNVRDLVGFKCLNLSIVSYKSAFWGKGRGRERWKMNMNEGRREREGSGKRKQEGRGRKDPY